MFLYMKLLNISICVVVIGMMAACVWLYRLCCVVFGWSDKEDMPSLSDQPNTT